MIVTHDNAKAIAGTTCTHRVWKRDGAVRTYHENGVLVGTLTRTVGGYVARHREEHPHRAYPRTPDGLRAAITYVMRGGE